MTVLISEALLLRASATDGRILWDRVLCGFGVRLNAEPWSLGQVQRVVTAALESTGPGKLKGEPSLPDHHKLNSSHFITLISGLSEPLNRFDFIL